MAPINRHDTYSHTQQSGRREELIGNRIPAASYSLEDANISNGQLNSPGIRLNEITETYKPHTISQGTHTEDRSPNESLSVPAVGDGSAKHLADNSQGVVNAMGATSFTDEHVSGSSNAFYGGSSAAYFMNQVKESVIGVKSPGRLQIGLPGSNSHTGLPQEVTAAPPRLKDTEDFVLPTRNLADRLFGVYWTTSHTLYPFLDQPSLERAYLNLWASSNARREPGCIDLGLGSTYTCDESTRVFQCALNAIFALGCQ